jgi:ABC-type Fe3+-hydroxamate transport system substrate-binding protein
MTDDFPNQLRKQFSIDRVLENPGFVAAVYVNERDHAADIIEDQQKRIEELEAALLDEITKAYVRGGKWAFANGASFAEYLDKAANDYADSRSALGEKKDA